MKIFFIFFLTISFAFAQKVLPVKIDDFNSTKNWWKYYRDGSVALDPTSIKSGDGFLKLALNNPLDSLECNVGISERHNIYSKNVRVLIAEARILLLNEMREGSRGFGFWKTARMGRADALAWFMEQYKINLPQYSWSRFGVIYKKKRQFKEIRLDNAKWHTYKIVRDISKNRTDFFIDNELDYSVGNLSPKGEMAFHIWVDNQVYSRTEGILHSSWNGNSSIVVDYIKIYSEQLLWDVFQEKGSIKLFEKPMNFGSGFNKDVMFERTLSLSSGPTIVLVSANAETYQQYDNPDHLTFSVTDVQNTPLKSAEWNGQSLTGDFLNQKIELTDILGKIVLKAISDNTPFISDIVVLNSPEGNIILDEQPVDQIIKNGLWKTYSFSSDGNPVVVYLSGIANESPLWNHVDKRGRNEAEDDNLRIELDNIDYGWNSNNSLDGNRQFGLNDVVLIREELTAGKHNLKLFTQNNPRVNRILIYQE